MRLERRRVVAMRVSATTSTTLQRLWLLGPALNVSELLKNKPTSNTSVPRPLREVEHPLNVGALPSGPPSFQRCRWGHQALENGVDV